MVRSKGVEPSNPSGRPLLRRVRLPVSSTPRKWCGGGGSNSQTLSGAGPSDRCGCHFATAAYDFIASMVRRGGIEPPGTRGLSSRRLPISPPAGTLAYVIALFLKMVCNGGIEPPRPVPNASSPKCRPLVESLPEPTHAFSDNGFPPPVGTSHMTPFLS